VSHLRSAVLVVLRLFHQEHHLDSSDSDSPTRAHPQRHRLCFVFFEFFQCEYCTQRLSDRSFLIVDNVCGKFLMKFVCRLFLFFMSAVWFCDIAACPPNNSLTLCLVKFNLGSVAPLRTPLIVLVPCIFMEVKWK